MKVAVEKAALEHIPRVKKKTKNKEMTEDILELVEKVRQVKSNSENYKSIHKEIRKKYDEAKEKGINDKCRNIDIYVPATEVLRRQCGEILKKTREREHAHLQGG